MTVWFQLNIENCPIEQIEQISEAIEETGALSIMLTDKFDNPILEPAPGTTPLWPEVIIHALYDQQMDADGAILDLKTKYPVLEIQCQIIEDQDWERAWMKDFKPQCFGQRLWICPSWATPPNPDAVNLMLDPGLAFGTGTHPTTALCLSWLDKTNLHQKTLIDYGCGSGILSLAAIKLGAKHVTAVDIDEQALQATQNNALTNNITAQQLTIHQPEELREKVDILLANILLEPLILLKDRFAELLKPQGLLVVSGILTEQILILTKAYEETFSLVNKETLENWGLLVLNRKELNT